MKLPVTASKLLPTRCTLWFRLTENELGRRPPSQGSVNESEYAWYCKPLACKFSPRRCPSPEGTGVQLRKVPALRMEKLLNTRPTVPIKPA